MAFKWAYNKSYPCAKPKEYLIPTATVIERGEMVAFTPGTGIVVLPDQDQDDVILGVAAESHDASTADFIGRQTGTKIKVYDDPNDVFMMEEKTTLTLTANSSTTQAVVSGLLPATNDLWINSYIEIMTCAADSELVGRLVKITDSVGATGALIFSALPSALATGDTIRLYPGDHALNEYGWDLNSDGTEIDYETSGGEAIQLVKADPFNKKSFWKLRLHTKGNDAAAK